MLPSLFSDCSRSLIILALSNDEDDDLQDCATPQMFHATVPFLLKVIITKPFCNNKGVTRLMCPGCHKGLFTKGFRLQSQDDAILMLHSLRQLLLDPCLRHLSSHWDRRRKKNEPALYKSTQYPSSHLRHSTWCCLIYASVLTE